jgi:2-polyprenyl-3-methyl-5-hydroxy-6-metoxy-1,4-benzoquinol methylase
VDEEIRNYYESGVESDRLEQGYSRIEFTRTKELLARYLPSSPARILDVGGGPGVYAEWLADQGHEVRLIDATPLHVRQALDRGRDRFTAAQGDARSLDEAGTAYDVVLLLGPLYHLLERHDRLAALGEAHRVLRSDGLLIAAAISRFASLLDGLYGGYLGDAAFSAIVERDLVDGRHQPSTDGAAFTTAYFHRPEELAAEIEEAEFAVEGVFGVEGPGWLLADREDAESQSNILRVARDLEQEPTVIGTSAHFLAVARKR